MNHPFFSICIPNFNYAGFIGQTIQSVISQSFCDYEIIIADNASSDHSSEVINHIIYQNTDKKIVFIQNKNNVGFAPNLQVVTSIARGKYIILLSSDDLMNDGALEHYYHIFASQGFPEDLILFSDAKVIDHNNNINAYLQFDEKLRSVTRLISYSGQGHLIDLNGKQLLKSEVLGQASTSIFCSMCYPAKQWSNVGGYDTWPQFRPDKIFYYKLLLQGCKVKWLSKDLFSYRIHLSNNLSQALTGINMKYENDLFVEKTLYKSKYISWLEITEEEIEVAYKQKIHSTIFRELKQKRRRHALKKELFLIATSKNYSLFSRQFMIFILFYCFGNILFLLKKKS